jgi:hypothetical protein
MGCRHVIRLRIERQSDGRRPTADDEPLSDGVSPRRLVDSGTHCLCVD